MLNLKNLPLFKNVNSQLYQEVFKKKGSKFLNAVDREPIFKTFLQKNHVGRKHSVKIFGKLFVFVIRPVIEQQSDRNKVSKLVSVGCRTETIRQEQNV